MVSMSKYEVTPNLALEPTHRIVRLMLGVDMPSGVKCRELLASMFLRHLLASSEEPEPGRYDG
jgi:hypothetical protein